MAVNTTEKILITGIAIGVASAVGYATYKKCSKEKQEEIDNQVVKAAPKLAEGAALAGEKAALALREQHKTAQAVFPS